jgi:ATP-dependent RNA helicase DeaD
VAITFAEPREHRLLRNIQAFTKQKIEVATVPTVADLRTRRLDVMRASLRERLLAGDAADVRVVVEALAEEFDVMQIAAAAVKMALEAEDGGKEEKEIPVQSAQHEPPASAERKPPPPRPHREKVERAELTRLYVGAGREMGVRPADLVGAIAGETGVDSRVIGSIEIADRFSIVEVQKDLADDIIAALRRTKIRGRKVAVNYDRPKKGAARR